MDGAAKSQARQQPGDDQDKIVSARQVEQRSERFDRSSSLWRRNRQHSGRPAKPDWRESNHAPSVRSDLYRSPALIAKVEVDVASMFGAADVHRPLRRVEKGASFEQIERGANRRATKGCAGRF